MNWTEELIALFDDPLLADVKPHTTKITSDDRFIESFLEINDWVTEHGKAPQEESPDFNERRLYRRLLSIRDDEENRELLKEYDTLNLLNH